MTVFSNCRTSQVKKTPTFGGTVHSTCQAELTNEIGSPSSEAPAETERDESVENQNASAVTSEESCSANFEEQDDQTSNESSNQLQQGEEQQEESGEQVTEDVSLDNNLTDNSMQQIQVRS